MKEDWETREEMSIDNYNTEWSSCADKILNILCICNHLIQVIVIIIVVKRCGELIQDI